MNVPNHGTCADCDELVDVALELLATQPRCVRCKTRVATQHIAITRKSGLRCDVCADGWKALRAADGIDPQVSDLPTAAAIRRAISLLGEPS